MNQSTPMMIADEYEVLFHANAPYAFADKPSSFVGRKREMEQLDEWLVDEDVSITAVISPLGTGKSSLLWQWQRKICAAPTTDIEEVIWWDASQPDADILHFLHTALIFVGDDPHIYRDARHQLERLLDQFLYRPFLLIIDGIERWLYAYERMDSVYNEKPNIDGHSHALSCVHPLAADLLSGLAKRGGATKTAVSSQLLPNELCNSKGDPLPTVRKQRLFPLTGQDGYHLFSNQSVRTLLSEVELIGEPMAYHPLTLRVLAGHAADPTITRLSDSIHFPDDSTRQQKQEAVLTMVIQALPTNALKLLECIAALPTFVSEDVVRDLFNGRCHQKNNHKTRSWAERLFRQEKEPERDVLMETAVILQQHGLLYPVNGKSADGKRIRRYGMHDIVRRLTAQQIADSDEFHRWMTDYYRQRAKDDEITGRELLLILRDAYYHLTRTGAYDEAYLFYQADVLPVVYSLTGIYRQERIEMLQLLFPDGELSGPRLTDSRNQISALHELADLYGNSGRFIHATYLYKQSVMILRKQDDKGLLVESLNALVNNQLRVGGLKVAAKNGRRALDLHDEISIRYKRIPGHWNYGRVLAYQGEWARARIEFGTAMGLAKAENAIRDKCITWSYLAQLALLRGDEDDGYAAASKAKTIADGRKDADLHILTDWLLGWASGKRGAYMTAEQLLGNALYHSRTADLIAFEPLILLAQARLLRAQKDESDRAWQLALTAVSIAERYDYKLDLAEINLFLTNLALDRGDYDLAHRLIKKAHTYARCDREPYVYKTIFEESERILKMLSYTL